MDRKQFMKLPMDVRREILRLQADNLVYHQALEALDDIKRLLEASITSTVTKPVTGSNTSEGE